MKKLFAMMLAAAMCLSLCIPAFAAEAGLFSSRFTYYTVTDPTWTYSSCFTITAEQSRDLQEMEDRIWDALSTTCGENVTGASECIDVVSDLIRDNNLDYANSGTYTFYYKNKIHYKEHLLTGQVTVELLQKIVRVDFASTEESNSRQMTITLR